MDGKKVRGFTMRADGTRVRDLTAIMQALPYIMPKRYDAQNWAEENLDEDGACIKFYVID